MNETQLDALADLFYNEAPYDYILDVQGERKYLKGLCSPTDKVCIIFAHDDYDDAVLTLFHEVAHANLQHKGPVGHTDKWEKEFVRLLTKYNYPRHLVSKHGVMGPNLRAYAEGR